MEESQNNPCVTCGTEQGDIQRLKKQIRELTEKLECSQLQNSLLTSECYRLRRELRESAFKGRSSLGGRSSTIRSSLPNEILRHIFAMATESSDLAIADNTGRNWKLSSTTRRAIPFVCKRWNAVGSEFLLEHIVIQCVSQPLGLLWTLSRLNTIDQSRILGYIRGMEIIMREEVDEAAIFGELTVLLLRKLPSGQLRRFGIDCGQCNGSRTLSVTDMIVEVLRKSAGQLEMLHLPCIDYSEWKERSGFEDHGTWQSTSYADLQLKKLSFTPNLGNWCSASAFGSRHEPGLLTTLARFIRSADTLDLRSFWLGGQNHAKLLMLLEGTTNIQTLHLDLTYLSSILDLQSLLQKLPRLRHIFISCNSRSGVVWPIEFSHPLLEEITIIYTRRYSSEEPVPFIENLEDQAKSNNYPTLKRITMHGYFSNGCLDSDCIFPASYFKRWENTIDSFREQDVELVDQEGRPIHLWRRRHAVKLEHGDKSTSSGSESEEDQWYETSDEDDGARSFSSDNGDISDDSDDKPYKYAHQRDLRPFVSDSEGEDQ